MAPDHVSRRAIDLQAAPIPEVTRRLDPRSWQGRFPRLTLLERNHLQNPERFKEHKDFTI